MTSTEIEEFIAKFGEDAYKKIYNCAFNLGRKRRMDMTSLEIEKIIARIGKETYKMIYDYAFSLGYKKGFDDGVWTAEGEE